VKEIVALIIDDEELGRRIIREYLGSHPEVEVRAECQDAYEALEAIDKHHPDLLFLDIQMPEIDGFELLGMLDEVPLVIFSTAYDQYALKAFEVNAIDYLLKPYDQERFDMALERAKRDLQSREAGQQRIEQLLEHLRKEKGYLKKLLIKQPGKIIILNMGEIQWIEAMADYVNIHTLKETYLVQQSLSHLESRLDPNRFVRIHRSSIVNLDAVQEIVSWANGRYKVFLQGGEELTISRSGAKILKKLML